MTGSTVCVTIFRCVPDRTVARVPGRRVSGRERSSQSCHISCSNTRV